MLRILCLLYTLAASHILVAQSDELPTAESVRSLYNTYGMPFDGIEAEDGRAALFVMSAGCAQCVELATQYREELIYLFTEQGFSTRFVDIPGAVAPLDADSFGTTGSANGSSLSDSAESLNALSQAARAAAHSASMILECSRFDSGEDAISFVADLGRAARLLVGTQPDPNQMLTTDWANWVYLSDIDDEGVQQSTATAVLQMVVGARNIDLSTCAQDEAWDILGTRHDAILASGITYVPGLYLLPNDAFPRFMVWDYEELLEIVTN